MNEESVEGLMSEITDSWDNKIFEFLGCINKKYHWHHKHSILLVSTMVIFIDAS
jgi:hypothetical protein